MTTGASGSRRRERLRLIRRRAELLATIARAGLWTARVRHRLPRSKLPVLVAELSRAPRRGKRGAAVLAAAVARIPATWTGPSQCLVRSLVLLRLCAEHGHPARLVLGVATGADRHPESQLAAHAWVELLAAPRPPPPGFAALARLP